MTILTMIDPIEIPLYVVSSNGLPFCFHIALEKRVHEKPCPWGDEFTKKDLDKRDKLLRRARESKNELHWRNAIKTIYPSKKEPNVPTSSDVSNRAEKFRDYFANVATKMKYAAIHLTLFIPGKNEVEFNGNMQRNTY